ncbi:MAG: hypothetical protein AAFX09_02630 [Pseudomonadota bacterium]
MFNVFPKLIIAIVVYGAIAFSTSISNGGDIQAFTGTLIEFQRGECVGMEGAGAAAVECRAGTLNRGLFSVPMAGDGLWVVTTSDLIITLSLILLFFEMLKAPSSGNASVFNNLLSTVVFILAILLFVLHPLFATSTFFIIMLMTLVDVAAGWFITTISSRRDLAVGGE